MSYNSAKARSEYIATAGQTVFPFPFKVFEDINLQIFLTPVGQSPNDVNDEITLTIDYTVVINGDNGGEITLNVGATAGDAITITRNLAIDRLVEYQTNGDLLAATLNMDMDYQAYMIADRDMIANTHISIPKSAQNISTQLPEASPGSYLVFNDAGDALVTDTTIPASVAITEANKVAAELAQTNAETAESNSEGHATTSLGHATTSLGHATTSQLKAWESEAEKMTADSYATEAEDVVVKTYTSDGDGTFTATPTTEYSALHHSLKAQATAITIPSKTSARNSVISAVNGVNALATTPTPSHFNRAYKGNGTSQNIAIGAGDGAEEVTNGSGSTTTGWTLIDGLVSSSGGVLYVDRNGATGYGIEQAITVEVGVPYEISVDRVSADLSGNGAIFVSNATSGAGELAGHDLTGNQTYKFSFIPEQTTVYLSLRVISDVNATVGYQNISIREITAPLASVSRPWIASASYTIGDYKTHNYIIYEALTTHTGVATTPDADATNWVAIADGVHLDADNADVWIKWRQGVHAAVANARFDTLRGSGKHLFTNDTVVEGTLTDTLTSFNSDGFSVGNNVLVNGGGGETYVAWTEYFDKMFSFTTNHGKRGICAYNAQSGKFMVSYQGSGTAGHEIPHGVGTKPDLFITKSRSTIHDWRVYNSARGATEFMELNENFASAADIGQWNNTEPTALVFTLGDANALNALDIDCIAYGSSNRKNHSYVGGYVGTGVAGNPVDVGMDLLALFNAGKNIKVLNKALTTAGGWNTMDSARGLNNRLQADSSSAETILNPSIVFTNDGIVINTTNTSYNAVGVQYLIEVTVEDFDNPNGGLDLNPTTTSYADGTNATGDVDVTATTIAPATYPQIAGTKNYFYTDFVDADTVTLGSTDVKLLEGLNRVDADKWGVVSPSDATLKTTDKHSDDASATGVASASSEFTTSFRAFMSFNKSAGINQEWISASGDNIGAWIDYNFSEKRVPKSLRFQTRNDVEYNYPSEISIYGKTGAVLTLIKSFTGISLTQVEWTAELDLLNTSDYDGIRLVVDAYVQAGGTATWVSISELELNTEHPLGDFYNVAEGVMYNSADTAIKRVYTAEAAVDLLGEIIPDTLMERAIKNQNFTDVTIHGNAEFLGDVSGKNICTAWVDFDGSTTPVTINDSYNVYDVVRVATGRFDVYFQEDMLGSNYGVSGTASANTATASSAYLLGSNNKSISKVEIQTRYVGSSSSASAFANLPSIHAEIKGGK